MAFYVSLLPCWLDIGMITEVDSYPVVVHTWPLWVDSTTASLASVASVIVHAFVVNEADEQLMLKAVVVFDGSQQALDFVVLVELVLAGTRHQSHYVQNRRCCSLLFVRFAS